jgi:hypothetical protein
MRTLAARCRDDVPAGDRSRGLDYQLKGRVGLGKPHATGVSARVRGSSWYTVELDWAAAHDGVLEAACECPRFADFASCKHVWAVILALDAAGLAGRVPGNEPLQLAAFGDRFEPFDDGDDGSLDDGLEQDDGGWLDDSRSRDSRSRIPGGGSFPSGRRDWDAGAAARGPAKEPSAWRRHLGALRQAAQQQGGTAPLVAAECEVLYVIDLAATRSRGQLVVGFFQRRRKRSGEWGKVKPLPVDARLLSQLPAGEDRPLLELLRAVPYVPWYGAGGAVDRTSAGMVLPALFDHLLPRLAATGRLLVHDGGGKPVDLARTCRWDGGEPWRFRLVADRETKGGGLRLRGEIYRGEQTVALAEPLLLTAGGLVFFADTIARLDAEADFSWIVLLRQHREVAVPAAEEAEALAELWSLPALPPISGADDLHFREERCPLRPRMELRRLADAAGHLAASVAFAYDTLAVSADDPRPALVDAPARRVLARDRQAEREALALVTTLPFTSADPRRQASWPPYLLRDVRGHDAPPPGTARYLAERHLPEVVDRLLAAGWTVEAEGAPLRRSGTLRFSVSSGIDWLDLAVAADFDGLAAAPRELLAALARRERFVPLGDGTRGILPQAWLDRYGSLARLAGESPGDGLRFAPTQALLLDALLAEAPQVDVDAAFASLRQRLLAGSRSAPVEEPPGFRGELRAYQRRGLGWLRFLTEIGFGGCLADDMGLGKTVQVLALLQGRHAEAAAKTNGGGAAERRPSLVVAPKSVVYNWLDEAARFAPGLRTLEYAGGDRAELRRRFAEHDLVVATYGMVRRDAAHLRSIPFDFAIFDEAQAVKNPTTQSHKACRLLQARHRVALSGTPVENHLGELWALLELLNPGLLGRLSASRTGSRGHELSDSALAAVGRAVRPFLLRRTKEEVLAELPPKTEQTVLCTLDGAQRRLYDELRRHYQQVVANRVAAVGLGRSKILVLEALLRLRQAACHAGLVLPERAAEPSAKLDTLCAQLAELREEGHKALVFSQFTKLLGLLRPRLTATGIDYEYLDGRTVDRKAKVERFQRDPDCSVFLVSLKAGGLGLNLTAAGYVFLLDPWWNPAAEAQAVDRAHRIGQQRPVFAYRLIARDTVEEKIVDLQRRKRRVADAILAADETVMEALTVEDVDLLLS